MSTYSKPQISISTTPERYSPAYGLNYFTFTASFANTTAYNPFVIVDVNTLSQWATSSMVLSNTVSRYKIPIREGNKFIFNTEKIIQNDLTYPFNDKISLGSVYSGLYVNEASGFGSYTQSFPTIAPDTDTIIKYNISYGLEFNPGVTFGRIGGMTGPFGTYSTYEIQGQNLFCDAGDFIQISMNSGIFNYYNGIHQVRTISTASFGPSITYITTNQIPNSNLLSLTAVTGSSISEASGYIINCKKLYGNSSAFNAFNGVRQFLEKGVNFSDLYLLKQKQTPNSFLEPFGYDSQHALPIAASSSYRARFLAEMETKIAQKSDITGRLSKLNWLTYDTSGTLVEDKSLMIEDTLTTNNCFTAQVFDGSEPIKNNWKYNFNLYGSGDTIRTFAGGGTASPYITGTVTALNQNFNNPSNITFNPNNPNKAYISHFFRVTEVDLINNLTTSITGASIQGTQSNRTASSARYYSPRKIVFPDTTNDFLLLDTRDIGSPFYWRILKYTATASYVTELFTKSNASAYDMCLDTNTKDLYVMEYTGGSSGIYKVAAPLYNTATLFYPATSHYGIAFDNNDLYFTDTLSNYIRKIPNLTPASVSVIAGNGTTTAVDNVNALSTGINKPHAIEVKEGKLYFSDLNNALIRKIDLSTNIVNTLVGNGSSTFSGDNGPGLSASLNRPYGLTIANNTLYIADTSNARIRQVGMSLLGSMWFEGYNPCSAYESIRIKWLNSLGSWSYWYFNKDLKQTTNVNTTSYKRPYDYDYTIDYTDPNFTLFKLRGTDVLSKAINETYILNSDWINEEQYAYLNEIIKSPSVYIFYDYWTDKSGNTLRAVNIPIIITDTTYEWKTRLRNKLFNLQISYNLSFETITQNK